MLVTLAGISAVLSAERTGSAILPHPPEEEFAGKAGHKEFINEQNVPWVDDRGSGSGVFSQIFKALRGRHVERFEVSTERATQNSYIDDMKARKDRAESERIPLRGRLFQTAGTSLDNRNSIFLYLVGLNLFLIKAGKRILDSCPLCFLFCDYKGAEKAPIRLLEVIL